MGRHDVLLAALARHDGLRRVARLYEEGFSRRDVAAARRDGVAVKAGRFWLAAVGADRLLTAAAARGVVITCATEAKRRGLWVRSDPAVPHVAAPQTAARLSGISAHVHWRMPVVPRHPDVLVDPLDNVLVIAAECLPREESLAIWESALNKKLVDRRVLEGLALPSAARRLLETADEWADAGTETLLATRLRWMKLPMLRQAWLYGRPVDLLVGDRLVIQVDGGTHVGAQRDADNAHDTLLMLRGYHVIRVGYRQLMDDWPAVQERIMLAVAQGLHRAA